MSFSATIILLAIPAIVYFLISSFLKISSPDITTSKSPPTQVVFRSSSSSHSIDNGRTNPRKIFRNSYSNRMLATRSRRMETEEIPISSCAYLSIIQSTIDLDFMYRPHLVGVMVLRQALIDLGSTADFLVIIITHNDELLKNADISKDLKMLTDVGIKIKSTPSFLPTTILNTYNETRYLTDNDIAYLNLIYAWNFGEYRRLQFISPEIVPTINMDCYFQLNLNSFTTGSQSPLSAGWIAIIPNTTDFQQLLMNTQWRVQLEIDGVPWDNKKGWGVIPEDLWTVEDGGKHAVRDWSFHDGGKLQGLLVHHFYNLKGQLQVFSRYDYDTGKVARDISKVQTQVVDNYTRFYGTWGRAFVPCNQSAILVPQPFGKELVKSILPFQRYVTLGGYKAPWLRSPQEQFVQESQTEALHSWFTYLEHSTSGTNNSTIGAFNLPTYLTGTLPTLYINLDLTDIFDVLNLKQLFRQREQPLDVSGSNDNSNEQQSQASSSSSSSSSKSSFPSSGFVCHGHTCTDHRHRTDVFPHAHLTSKLRRDLYQRALSCTETPYRFSSSYCDAQAWKYEVEETIRAIIGTGQITLLAEVPYPQLLEYILQHKPLQQQVRFIHVLRHGDDWGHSALFCRQPAPGSNALTDYLGCINYALNSFIDAAAAVKTDTKVESSPPSNRKPLQLINKNELIGVDSNKMKKILTLNEVFSTIRGTPRQRVMAAKQDYENRYIPLVVATYLLKDAEHINQAATKIAQSHPVDNFANLNLINSYTNNAAMGKSSTIATSNSGMFGPLATATGNELRKIIQEDIENCNASYLEIELHKKDSSSSNAAGVDVVLPEDQYRLKQFISVY